MSQTLPSRALPTVLLVALVLSTSSWAQESEPVNPPPQSDSSSERPETDFQRVPVPSLSTENDHPFSIEVPLNWKVRRDLPAPGVFLGPPGGDPNSHPEMLLVHESRVALDSPETILANLRSQAETAEWSLRKGKVVDFGGVQGLWIVREMPPEGFHGERVSFAVKLPLGDMSLDVLATVPAEESDSLAPRIESMLRSVRPTDTAAAPADEPEN